MHFDLVIDEMTPDGEEARVSKTSVAGSWGAIAGELRYFADRFGVPRAAIEGTQIPLALIRKYATRGAAEIVFDADRKRAPLVVRRAVEYYGFVLERDIEPIDDVFPEDVAEIARVWGTLLGVRGQSRGESFVARNVGLRSVWEDGEWRVKLIFMDHDALTLPEVELGHFFAQNAFPGQDER